MKQFSLRRLLFLPCIALAVFLFSAPLTWAGGGQHYPNGVEDFAVGALPPPGVYLVNYLLLVQKNSIKDNSGNSVPADFKADVVAEVPRLIYVSPFKLLGANWGAHVFLPFYHADVKSSSDIPPLNFDSRDTGMGDLIFSPLILGWHFTPSLHAVFALDTRAPTGDYDKNRPATQILSRNHWTFEPVVAVSYLKEGFDVSAKLMYDFNTRNSDTGTDPGQEFHIDWAAGYGLSNGLSGGVVGYNYWQTTDDKVNGVRVEDANSRVGGIGFGIKYWPKQGPFSMTFKQYWEYGARNIATGPQTQFKISYAF
ncbi:putative signal peptide protein [Geobacter metallireducens RCH3]|uniref:SphA family protein n=1 Tax=Geobacter metallireducens TaxID=28232 RepID=UPI00024A5273|nr:transporter [Geobacter metallireducens]EHP86773.1 putative signal peptide protein [Geobacter metallireducens RCH3]